MSVAINKDGKLVIVVDAPGDDAADALITRRNTLYDLISDRSEDQTDFGPVYYGIEMLRDLEFTYEQVKEILNKDTSTKKNE